MEARAPYHAAPHGPRNLAEPLGEWLRGLDFSTQQQALPAGVCLLTAQWISPAFERFELTYTWQAQGEATCQLRRYYQLLGPQVEVLFAAQRVRRLKEARLLVLGNVCLAEARRLTKLYQPLSAST